MNIKIQFCVILGYTLLLWLSSDEDVSPAAAWSDSNSPYNSDLQTTIQDLQHKNTKGYRYTLIDRWLENPPDKVNVAIL